MKDLTADQLQPLIGSRFTLAPAGGDPFEVELTEVTRLEAHDGPRTQPFSIVFVDPRKGGALPQQLFRVEHAALESMELFLVPVGPVAQGMRYEAVFN